jgi:hypothetical protein
VAHLEHPAAVPSDGKKLFRLGEGGGDRLFDEHIDARAQGFGDDLVVVDRRNCDDRGVELR